MKYDFWRFAGVLFISFLVGFVSGYLAVCVISGLLLFIVWQYREFSKIHLWLKTRQESNCPSQLGIVDETCREIDFLKKRHRDRKTKLAGYLKRFQEATAALPDAVVVLGQFGEIEWANDKATEYMGIRWPQDAELRISNLVRDPKLIRYLTANEEELKKGLQLNSPVNMEINLEIRLSAYGDTQKLLFARDVTKINQINKVRKDFIANASHELRTPLTVLSGYLEGFADDDLCPKEWLSYIRQMRTQASRMQNLIKDLLQLSSLEVDAVNNDKESIPVPDILNSIVNEARSLSGFHEHKILLEVDETLYIKGNQQQLYSAFSNLVFNAVQYTPEKGTINIKWYEDNTGAHFSVVDNGAGIAPEHIARLTERFYRVDKGRSRNSGGTGLGLAIVKHVLSRHKALLHVESKVGKGSLFRCDFPSNLCIFQPQANQQVSRTSS